MGEYKADRCDYWLAGGRNTASESLYARDASNQSALSGGRVTPDVQAMIQVLTESVAHPVETQLH